MNETELKDILGDLSLNEAALAGLVNLVEGHVKKALKETEDELDKTKDELESTKAALSEAEAAATKAEEEAEEAKKDLDEAMAQAEAEKEELKEHAQAYADSVRDAVVARVDEYTGMAMKEFIKENEEKFKSLEDYTRMKSIFESVKSSFEQNGFPLNESASIDALRKDVRDSKAAYDSLFEDLIRTRQELDTAKMAIIFEEASKDLTVTQKEKLKTLSESVQFTDVDEFQTTVGLLIEQVMKPEKPEGGVAEPKKNTLNESFSFTPKPTTRVSPGMEAILKALGTSA